MKLIVADTETASLDGGVCDIAAAVLDENLNIVQTFESLIDPERKISPSASGIHHITDEMVWDKPTLAEFMDMTGRPFDDPELVIGGHNIQYDVRVLGSWIPAGHRKLCTLRLARNLWPEIENHKLQTLRYHFKLDAGTAHRAMGDVVACISLMRMIVQEQGWSLQQLIHAARRPLSPETKMTFGKHKGTKIKDLPKDYVNWLLTKADNTDADLREALEALQETA